MTSTIRNITYDDLKLKAAKLERGFIHKCPNCGVNDKITGVEEGQKKHIVCPACKLGGTILASKKSLVLVTCPHCSDIVSYPGQAKEGVFKCAKCGNDYIVASPNTVNMLRTKYKGLVNYEGKWLTSNELLQAQFGRKMSSEGKIQCKGQWMSSNDWRHAKIANRDYKGLDKFYGNELNGKNHEDILPYYGKVVRMRGVVIKYDATDKHWVCATKYNSSGDQEAFSFEWDDDPPQLDSPYVVWGIVSGYTTGRVLRVTQGGMTKVKRMSSSGGSTKV